MKEPLELIPVTPQQRKNAEYALNVMWPAIEPEDVVPDLGTWVYETECGTLACFGGHCALDPTFQAQGITVGHYGQPLVRGDYPSSAASYQLFGARDLFTMRDCHPADTDDESTSGHAIVTLRLQWLIANSVVVEAE